MHIEPGDKLLYMKVGVHAQEPLDEIIKRKRQEIEDEGFAMWGYGGNTCHPLTMVRPFITEASGPIWLAMQPMESKHDAPPIRAEQFSADGVNWSPIPKGINVKGSRLALCIDSLDAVDTQLDLGATEVAVGPSRGRNGMEYISGRVDKACLSVLPHGVETSKIVPIGLAARLVEPFAVFVRD